MSNTGTLRGRDQETYLEVALSGTAGITLDPTQAIKKVLRFTGTLGADVTVRLSLNREFSGLSWTFENLTTGGFTVTVAPLSGSGVDVAPGINTGAWFDGTNLIGTGSAAAAGLPGTVGGISQLFPIVITNPQIGDAITFIDDHFENAPSAAGGQLVLTIDASVILTTEQAENTNIELRAGTIDEPWTLTFPDNDDGRTWICENTTGQPCTLVGFDGSQSFLVNNARCEVLWDGDTLTRTWLSAPTHFNYAGFDPITFDTWDQVDADYIEFTPIGGSVTVNWPNGGSLGKRGRRQTIKNDHTSQYIDVKTNGAGADKTTRLLPGETASFVIDDTGAIVPDWTRAFERRVSVAHDNSATYTVLHPDFLAQVIVVTGDLSATRNLVLPAVNHKSWVIQNDADEALIVKTAAGTGVTLYPGKTRRVACDGTNIVPLSSSTVTSGVEYIHQRASDGQVTLGAAAPFASGGVTQGVVLAGEVFVNTDVTFNALADFVLPSANGPRWGTSATDTQAWWGGTPSVQMSPTGNTTQKLLDNLLTQMSVRGLVGGYVSPFNVSTYYFFDSRTLTGAHNDPVGSLTDLSGSARTPTAAGGARGTLQVTSNTSPNGSQLVRFDGTDDQYSYSGAMPNPSGGIIFTVGGNFRAKGGVGQAIFGDDTSARPLCVAETNPTLKYGWGDANGSHVLTGAFSAGWQVVQWVFRSPAGGTGVGEVYRNGVSQGTALWDWNYLTSAGFYVSGNAGGNVMADVDLGMIHVAVGDTSAATVAGLRGWVNSNFGT